MHPRRPSRHRLPVLLGAAALTAAALVVGTQPATAGPPGTWTNISTGSAGMVDGSTTAPSAVRLANGNLLVVWVNKADSLHQALYSRVISATTARPIGSAVQVLPTTWSSLTADPKALLMNGKPIVVFSGLRSTDSTDPWTGPMGYASTDDGRLWTFHNSQSLSASRSAYGSYGIDAVMDGSQLVVAYTKSSANAVTVHRGIANTVPAAGGDIETSATSDVLDPALARDSSTGQVWTFWYSLSGGATVQGISAQRMYPSMGTRVHGPGSTTTYSGSTESVSPDQRVAAAGRVGGGVWAAYAKGYPTAKTIVLWNPVTGRTLSMKRPDGVRRITLASAPGGRLWVLWTQDSSNRVFASRTNPGVTRFGTVRSLPLAGKASHSPYLYKLAAEGSRGYVDVVYQGQANPLAGGYQVYHQRLLAGLAVKAKPKHPHAGGKLTVKVSDAGVPVAGAKVKFLHHKVSTNRKGKAKFTISAGTSAGKYKLKVKASGYAKGKLKIKVR
jgi:hypothetical protein